MGMFDKDGLVCVEQDDLSRFYGTEHYYKVSPVLNVMCTDGVHHIVNNGCGWLIDAIASYQPEIEQKAAKGNPEYAKLLDFQVWQFFNVGDGGRLSCKSDSTAKETIVQKFTSTSLRTSGLKFYVIHNVILLPSEY